MKNYLIIAEDQLKRFEGRVKEKPPSDEHARITWAIEQVRDMIIKADVKLHKGEDIMRDVDRMEQAFRYMEKLI